MPTSDSLSCYLALDTSQNISVGVILVNCKSPDVAVVAAVQDDLFLQVARTKEVRPSGVPGQRGLEANLAVAAR